MAGSIGDALGAVTENMNYSDIQKKYGRVDNFFEGQNEQTLLKAGAVTDDTTLKHVMCIAIIRKNGRIMPEDLAKIWIEELNLDHVSNPDKISCMKMRVGVSPWETGRGNVTTCCPSMSVTPIGIINAGDPEQAYQDGYTIASMSGEGFNVEAAAIFSAGVASAFIPGATWEDVIDTMTKYSRYTMLKCVDLTMNLAHKSSDVEQFRARYYETLADWWSRATLDWDRNQYPNGTASESIPVAMALTYLCKGNMREALIESVNFGRDTDTIANFVGSMLGPVTEIDSLDSQWIAHVEKESEFLFKDYPAEGVTDNRSLSVKLADCLKKECDKLKAKRSLLERIIAS